MTGYNLSCTLFTSLTLIPFDFSGQSTYDTKGKTAIDSAYRYDPRFDKWLQIASLNEKRTFFHLSTLKGKLFAVGGRNASGEIGELQILVPRQLSVVLLLLTARHDFHRHLI